MAPERVVKVKARKKSGNGLAIVITTVLLLLAILFALIIRPVAAYDSDNVTSVDLSIYNSDNLSIAAANVTVSGNITATATITDLEDVAETHAETLAASVNDAITAGTGLILVILFVAIAYVGRERLEYGLAGLVCILYGMSLWGTSEYMSIALAVAGIFMFTKAQRAKRQK